MAGHAPPVSPMQLWIFCPAYAFELLFQSARFVVMSNHLLDQSQSGLQAYGNNFIGNLFFVKDHNPFDGSDSPLQIGAEDNHLLNRKRRPRNCLERAQMSALKSPGY